MQKGSWVCVGTGMTLGSHISPLSRSYIEQADVVFVVLCLANQTGIDLQVAFDKKMDLKSVRDKDRHKNNEKLK